MRSAPGQSFPVVAVMPLAAKVLKRVMGAENIRYRGIMSAFSFNTTYQPTGDQQKDAIAQIDIMQNRAVQANLAYQSSLDAETLMKQLGQINDELGALLDSVENHTPVIRKKASDLSALMMLFSQQTGQSMSSPV